MMFWGWYIDPLYFLLFVVTFLISAGAQVMVSSAYHKWSAVKNSSGLTGGQVGRRIIQKTGLGVNRQAPVRIEKTPELTKLAALREKGIITPEEYEAKRRQIVGAQSRDVAVSRIKLERVPGQMTDHYDPRSHTVRMSDGVATRPSVAAMAIVAHELGHAQQHENHSPLITLRSLLVPAVNFSSPLAYICILFGFLFNLAGLVSLGILFYAVMVVFTLITLPVEFDASRRGLRLLEQAGLMRSDADRQGARQVLRAAAMTYVAAAVTAILTLLYYLRLAGRGRR